MMSPMNKETPGGALRATGAQLAAAVGGRLVRGTGDGAIRGVSIDSRSVRPGEAFFALKGEHHDAHDYVAQAAQSGAGAVVVCEVRPEWALPDSCAVILCADTARALRDTAAWHRAQLGAATLAVTGSCGKTTTRSLAAAVLADIGPTACAVSSFNNRIGVSLTLLSAGPDHRFLVTELGANHPGEIDELASVVRPDVGVITTVGAAHLEGFGTEQGVMNAKGELIPHIRPGGTLVINGENRWCKVLARRHDGPVVRFGLSAGADIRPEGVECRPDSSRFEVRGRKVVLAMPGRFNVLNAVAALAACEALCPGALDHAGALASVALPPLRSQVTMLGGVTFIEDCYNSNPTAMRSAVELMDAAGGLRRIAVVGDMLELGEQSAAMHRRAGRDLARAGVGLLLALGGQAAETVRGFRRAAPSGAAARAFPSEAFAEMCRVLTDALEPGSCVLVKGSRGMRMERVLEAIKTGLGSVRTEERPAA